MSRAGRRIAGVVCAALLAACSLLTNLDDYTGGESTTGADATADAPAAIAEAGDDAAPPPEDAGTDARDADAEAGPPPVQYACGAGTTVTDCSTCASAKFPCVLCADAGANTSKMFAVCVTSATSGSACEGRGPAGYDDCLCNTQTDPSPCTEPYHVCLLPFGPACRTCGYDGGTGLKCKGGGTCQANGQCL